MIDVFNEWITKQRSVYKDIAGSQCEKGGQFMSIDDDDANAGFYFGDYEISNAIDYLKMLF